MRRTYGASQHNIHLVDENCCIPTSFSTRLYANCVVAIKSGIHGNMMSHKWVNERVLFSLGGRNKKWLEVNYKFD